MTTADLSPLMGSALIFNQEDSFRVSVCIYTEQVAIGMDNCACTHTNFCIIAVHIITRLHSTPPLPQYYMQCTISAYLCSCTHKSLHYTYNTRHLLDPLPLTTLIDPSTRSHTRLHSRARRNLHHHATTSDRVWSPSVH